MTSFLVPWPPSVNARFGVVRGKNILSKRYRDWMDDAMAAVVGQNPDTFYGPVEVDIQLGSPTKRLFDLDNRAKPILDLMVHLRIIEEDNVNIVKRLTLSEDKSVVGAMVTVRAA